MPSTLQLAALSNNDITAIAPAYSRNIFPVVKGQLCTRNDKLYKAKQDILEVENWTASHWEETTVEAELKNKLDKPVVPGRNGQVLTSDGNGGQEWRNSSGGGGTGDYEDLLNKPQINGVTLVGNKSLHDIGAAAESDIPDITAKADKVNGATEGNFAALDSEGNLIDSGHKHSDYLSNLRIYDISVPANTSEDIVYHTANKMFLSDQFTDKSAVISVQSTNDKYYASIAYTLETRKLSYTIKILPGAPNGTINMFITELK